MKAIEIPAAVFIVLGAFALLLWPFVVIPDAMSLAVPRGPSTGRAFLIGTLVYPVVYVPSLIIAIVYAKRNRIIPITVATAVPIFYLIVLVGWGTS